MDGKARSKVALLRMSRTRAQVTVRERAQDTANVIIGDHAKQRMVERDITATDAYRALRSGILEEGPTETELGETKVKMVLKIRGAREVGVVTIILHGNRLFVKTVEWEDLS